LLLDTASAVNATDPLIALIDRFFLISLNARQALDEKTAYSLVSLATFSRMRSKNFCSLRWRTYSHPQFQNITTTVECSTLVLV